MPLKANLDLNNITPDQGFTIIDSSLPSNYVMIASSIGDITGNGLGAIAYTSYPSALYPTEQVSIKILFGNANFTKGETVDLAQYMDGVNGFQIYLPYSEYGGVWPVGRICGGDYDAFAIKYDNFKSWIVIYGNDNFPPLVTINQPFNLPIPGLFINFDLSTSPLGVYTGDVNGDTLSDMAFPGETLADIAQTYIIFGNESCVPSTFNISDLNGKNGFVLQTNIQQTNSTYCAIPISSVNNDIYDDLISCNSSASAYPNITSSGQCVVVYGAPTFPAFVNVTAGENFNGILINGPMYDNAQMSANADNSGFNVNGNNIILNCFQSQCSNQLAFIFGNQNLPPVISYDNANFTITGISFESWFSGDFNQGGVNDIGVILNKTTSVVIMANKAYAHGGNISLETADYIAISPTNDPMQCNYLRDFDGDGYSELFCAYESFDLPVSNVIGYVLYSNANY